MNNSFYSRKSEKREEVEGPGEGIRGRLLPEAEARGWRMPGRNGPSGVWQVAGWDDKTRQSMVKALYSIGQKSVARCGTLGRDLLPVSQLISLCPYISEVLVV